MYVGEDWDTETRYAGIWATGFDASDSVSAYPIVAWRNAEGDGPGFFAYDYDDSDGEWGWIKLRDAVPEDYGKWHTLEFELSVGTGFKHYVDGVSLLDFADTTTVSLGNVILNVKNYAEDYDVYWDNFGYWDAKVTGQMSINASNVGVDGLILSNPGQAYGMTIDDLATVVDITDNLFADIGSESLSANVKGLYLVKGSDNVTVENNLFERIFANEKSVNAVYSGDTAATDPSTGFVIQDNRFLNITSQTKGGYGILLNNAAGNPGVLIDGNRFSGISGGWTHAVGMEGSTLNAVVTDNTFYNLTAAGTDNSAVFFEDNPDGGSVDVSGNRFQFVGYGVAIHPNDLPGGANGYDYTVDASPNYWGSACGPSPAAASVGDNVIYSPWYTDVTLTTTASGAFGEYIFFSNTATTELMNELIACAEPGSQLIFEDETHTYPGGLVVGADKTDLFFQLNGAIVGSGSSAFTIYGDNITINGPGVIEGPTSPGPEDNGVRVKDGADNLIIDGVEVRAWPEAIRLQGAHESFKLVNSWIHSNGNGFVTDDDVTLIGVVTIEGNLFKANGAAVQHNAPGNIDFTYNSWGYDTGPQSGDIGSGVTGAGTVYFDPWVFSEIYLDMQPDTAGDQYTGQVIDVNGFEIAVMADAKNLSGLSFVFQYDDTRLVMDGTPTFISPWLDSEGASCDEITGLASNQVGYYCNFNVSGKVWNGGEVARFTFHAINSGKAIFDVLHADELKLSSGSLGGVKIWVNNAGFNDPSVPERDITDGNDGELDIFITQFTGFIDLEGRPNDSGAEVKVYDDPGGTIMATATSVSSGKYTTAYETGQHLVDFVAYSVIVDRALFLPTGYVYPSLSSSPLTSLNILLLLGGDATDDNQIDISDAACIGNAYGTSNNMCSGGPGANSDVNEDGIVNIYDLTLMGGNYTKVESPWSPQ
jgi:hypothetical protein